MIVAAAAYCVGKELSVIMVNVQKPKLILWGRGGGVNQASKTKGALMRRIDVNLYVDNVVYLN